MTTEQTFYQICAGEIGVVLIGFVNVPIAVFVQILVPLVVFRDLIVTSHLYHSFLFISSYTLGIILFTSFLLLNHNMYVSLLIIAFFTLLSLFLIMVAENHMYRYFNGAS